MPSSSSPLEVNGQTGAGTSELTLASVLTRRAEALFTVGEYEVSKYNVFANYKTHVLKEM